jgi:hypothetical protein
MACTCDPGPEGQHQWYCGLDANDALAAPLATRFTVSETRAIQSMVPPSPVPSAPTTEGGNR